MVMKIWISTEIWNNWKNINHLPQRTSTKSFNDKDGCDDVGDLNRNIRYNCKHIQNLPSRVDDDSDDDDTK